MSKKRIRSAQDLQEIEEKEFDLSLNQLSNLQIGENSSDHEYYQLENFISRYIGDNPRCPSLVKKMQNMSSND